VRLEQVRQRSAVDAPAEHGEVFDVDEDALAVDGVGPRGAGVDSDDDHSSGGFGGYTRSRASASRSTSVTLKASASACSCSRLHQGTRTCIWTVTQRGSLAFVVGILLRGIPKCYTPQAGCQGLHPDCHET